MLDSIQAWEGAVVIQDTFTTETDIPGLCLREGQQAREVRGVWTTDWHWTALKWYIKNLLHSDLEISTQIHSQKLGL